MTQIDLSASQQSGLRHALHILQDIKGVGYIEFQKSDIVRHKLVQRIVEAYDKDDERGRKEVAKKREKQ